MPDPALASALAKLERGTVWVPIDDAEAAALADRARKDDVLHQMIGFEDAGYVIDGPMSSTLREIVKHARSALAGCRGQEQP